MNFVLLYGPPGVGKLTVGRELARLTGYKLFDNHVSIDAVRRVFDFQDAPFWPLVVRFRFDVYEAAARHGVDLITTLAFVYPQDCEIVEGWLAKLEQIGARLCLVHLTCRADVLEQRVQSEERRIGSSKQTWLDDKHYLTPIPNRHTLAIENSDLPPVQVAERIAGHFSLAPGSRVPGLASDPGLQA